MELNEALRRIRVAGYRLPIDEIRCIREHRDEAIPVLLVYIKTPLDMGQADLPEDYDAHAIAMYLLAEFKVNEAFPYLIRYLELDADYADYLLSDLLTEDFGRILTSVAVPSDIPAIKAIVENREIDVFQRHAAVNALLTLYAEGRMEHGELSDYLGGLLASQDDDPTFLAFVICDCEDIYTPEHMETIERLFQDDLIDDTVTDLVHVKRRMAEDSVDTAMDKLRNGERYTAISDTIHAISGWICYRKKPDFGRKVGRNVPCPCGSGLKYKKCCGAAVR